MSDTPENLTPEDQSPPAGSSPGLSRIVAAGVVIALIIAAPFLRDRFFPEAVYVQEIGHELTGHRYLYDEQFGWRNIPNWEATTYSQKLTTNSLGMRDGEYAVQKPPKMFRILLLGGSYTWGYGVADDEVYSAVLEEELARAGHQIEILNTGVSGWSTDQQLLYLDSEGFRYSPDLVLLALNIPDTTDYNTKSVQFGLAKPLFMDEALTLANSPVPAPGSKYPRLKSKADPVRLTGAIVDRMATLCEEHSCPLAVMKFGAFHYRQHPDFKSNQKMVSALNQLEESVLSKLAAHSNITVLDLDAQFGDREVSFTRLMEGNHDGHWNAWGHKEVAEILRGFLSDHQWTGSPQ